LGPGVGVLHQPLAAGALRLRPGDLGTRVPGTRISRVFRRGPQEARISPSAICSRHPPRNRGDGASPRGVDVKATPAGPQKGPWDPKNGQNSPKWAFLRFLAKNGVFGLSGGFLGPWGLPGPGPQGLLLHQPLTRGPCPRPGASPGYPGSRSPGPVPESFPGPPQEVLRPLPAPAGIQTLSDPPGFQTPPAKPG